MNRDTRSLPGASLAIVLTAIAAGALAGLIAASFVWCIEETVRLVWVELPERLELDAFGSWWLFAIPIVGGALVGVGQMALGNYPRPIDEAVETWRGGGGIEPDVAPRTAVNSLIALAAGGPVGFEAALTGVLGGTATWVGRKISLVGQFVTGAWGADADEAVPRSVRRLPYWLAALASLFTFHWLPFGKIDTGFRFTDFGGDFHIGSGLAALAIGALLAVPAAWAVAGIARAEHSMLFSRSPVLAGMAGGLAIALLAVPNELVLFSGQQGIQLLPDAPTGELLYLSVAKWAALVIALLAGWRGGPIFPTYTSAAAIAVVAADIVDVRADILIVAALAAVGVVLLSGNIPVATALTLYAVDFSYTGVILVGCVGAAVGLSVARSAAMLPAPARDDDGASR